MNRRILNDRQDSGTVSKLEVCTSYEPLAGGGDPSNSNFNVVSKYCDRAGVPQHKWPPPLLDQEFDVGVVASFGKLVTKKVISSFPL